MWVENAFKWMFHLGKCALLAFYLKTNMNKIGFYSHVQAVFAMKYQGEHHFGYYNKMRRT